MDGIRSEDKFSPYTSFPIGLIGCSQSDRGIEDMKLKPEVTDLEDKAEVNSGKDSDSWPIQRVVGLVLSLSALALSVYFQGTGFLVLVAFQKRLDKYKRFTIISLIAIQSLQSLTYLGSEYGPIISHVGPSVPADEFVDE